MADKKTAQDLLKAQRRRAVGGLMGYLEQHVYPRMTQAERDQLRAKVLATVDSYHDFALDLVGVYADDQSQMVNERYLEVLEQIHAAVTA